MGGIRALAERKPRKRRSSVTVRVLIAEDDPERRSLFRAQIQTIPGFEVVGHALDEDRAADLCGELDPEIVLIGLDDEPVAAAGARVKQSCPGAKVMVIAAASPPEIAQPGADIVLARPVGTDQFVASLLELADPVESLGE